MDEESINQKKLLIVINVDWFFLAHRKAIAKKAMDNGFKIIVAAKDTGRSKEIIDLGFEFIDLNVSRSGTNPIQEIKLMYNIYDLYKQIKPNLIYQVTMKPVIYGCLISKALNIPTVNGICGLGYNFIDKNVNSVKRFMFILMKLGFNKRNNHFVFENDEDYKYLKENKVIHKTNKISVIRGVGVNLDHYKFHPIPKNEKILIILPARMLWDKGVKEFVDAALLLKKKYFEKVFFKLYGMIDTENKNSVPQKYLEEIKIEGYLEWMKFHKNMVSVYKTADIVVLPSYYREGTPTVLIEACAVGRPIVTTRSVGCNECVDEGKNGYKIPIKSSQKLANAIEKLINSEKDRKRMGIYARLKAESEFDERVVVSKHLKIFESYLAK